MQQIRFPLPFQEKVWKPRELCWKIMGHRLFIFSKGSRLMIGRWLIQTTIKKFQRIVRRFYKLAFPPLQSRKSEKIHSQKQLRSQYPLFSGFISSHSTSICTQLVGSLKEKLLYCKSISSPVRQELKPQLLSRERTESFDMTACFWMWFTASAEQKTNKPAHSAFPTFHSNIYWEPKINASWFFIAEFHSKFGPAFILCSTQWDSSCDRDLKRGACLRDVDFSLSDKQLFLNNLHNDYFCCEFLEERHHLLRIRIILYSSSGQMRSHLAVWLEWKVKELVNKWIAIEEIAKQASVREANHDLLSTAGPCRAVTLEKVACWLASQ